MRAARCRPGRRVASVWTNHCNQLRRTRPAANQASTTSTICSSLSPCAGAQMSTSVLGAVVIRKPAPSSTTCDSGSRLVRCTTTPVNAVGIRPYGTSTSTCRQDPADPSHDAAELCDNAPPVALTARQILDSMVVSWCARRYSPASATSTPFPVRRCAANRSALLRSWLAAIQPPWRLASIRTSSLGVGMPGGSRGGLPDYLPFRATEAVDFAAGGRRFGSCDPRSVKPRSRRRRLGFTV